MILIPDLKPIFIPESMVHFIFDYTYSGNINPRTKRGFVLVE